MPAKFSKQRVVLEHLALRDFEPGARYPESAVDDTLRGWCEGGAADHASVRRGLVEHGLLAREAGIYWLVAEVTKVTNVAEGANEAADGGPAEPGRTDAADSPAVRADGDERGHAPQSPRRN
jgi:hypothetical protein